MTRILRRFAWLPRTINGQRVWLAFYYADQFWGPKGWTTMGVWRE